MPPPPEFPPSTPFPSVELCSTLYATSNGANFSQCKYVDDRSTGCDPSTLQNCECIVIDPDVSAGASEAVESLRVLTRTQAIIQAVFSSISILLLSLFLVLHALAPRRMWAYPASLAFWLYVCDLAVAIQFLVVAAFALAFTDEEYGGSTDLSNRWPITSNANCLCDFSPFHPGCTCRSGILSLMQQAGLVGSTAFYACLSHNLYRSVADPFTRPSSRYGKYLLKAWAFTLAASIPFVWPREHPAERLHGFGFHPHYLMCWSPVRLGPNLINNYQLFFFSTLPICVLLGVALWWYVQAWALLKTGGEKNRAIMEPREVQLRHSRRFVVAQSCFAVLIAGFYLPFESVVHADDPVEACGNAFEGPCQSSLATKLRPGFSIILCLRGAVDALVGFYTNWDTVQEVLANIRRRLAWAARAAHSQISSSSQTARTPLASVRSATSSSKRVQESTMHAELLSAVSKKAPDISESLRLEIVSYTMRGIQETARASSGSGLSTGEAAAMGAGATMPCSAGSVEQDAYSYDEVTTVTLSHGAEASIDTSVSRLPDRLLAAVPSWFSSFRCNQQTQRDLIIFKEYVPQVWASLRRNIYKVSSEQFITAFAQDGSDGPQLLRALAKFSEAKGGGFFFFSPDQRYMVKSMTTEEHRTMMRILPAFREYMQQNPNSTITRIYGLYSIQMYGQKKHFYVMDNCFYGCPTMNEIYDLKGSWMDRHAKTRASKVRLDSDWPPSKYLQVSSSAARRLLAQVCGDVIFLRSCGLMDYSMLIGIHHVTEQRLLREPGACGGALTCRSSVCYNSRMSSGEVCVGGGVTSPLAHGALSSLATENNAHELQEGPHSFSAVVLEGPGLYRMGLIDLLQEWTVLKRAERLLKIIFKGRCAKLKRDGISAIEPSRYAWRFVDHFGVKLLGMPPEEVKQVWALSEEAHTALMATPSVGASAPSVSVSIKSQASSGSRASLKSASPFDCSATEMGASTERLRQVLAPGESDSEPGSVASASSRIGDEVRAASCPCGRRQSGGGASSGNPSDRERSRTPPPTTRF